jgi:hypothetical protein
MILFMQNAVNVENCISNEEGIKEVNIFLGLLAPLFVKPQM